MGGTGLVAAVPGPQKKHLLHLLVKKVLIRDRRSAEVWYRLPDESTVRIQSDLVPPAGLYATRMRRREPELSFTRSGRFYFSSSMRPKSTSAPASSTEP